MATNEIGIEGALKIGYAIRPCLGFSCQDDCLSSEGETASLMRLRGVPLETLFLCKAIPLGTIVLFADIVELRTSLFKLSLIMMHRSSARVIAVDSISIWSLTSGQVMIGNIPTQTDFELLCCGLSRIDRTPWQAFSNIAQFGL